MSPNRAPVCPACGAKFSHDSADLRCKRCGLPDEIAHLGPKVISRWKRKQGLKRRINLVIGGSAGRKKNKHGRKGVRARD